MGFLSSLGNAFGFGGGGDDIDPEDAIRVLREQFNQTSENVQPFIDGGFFGLDQLLESATPEGLDDRLGRIFGTQSFQNLRDERVGDVQGQLAAGGLTRSGGALEAISNISPQLGLQIEQLLTGRSSGLADAGRQSAFNLGQLGAQNAGSIASLLNGAQIGNAQQQASQGSNAFGLLGNVFGGLSGGDFGETLSTVGSIGSLFFSDPALKKNVVKIGNIGPLNLYEWEWIDRVKDTIVARFPTAGFLSSEVKVFYPQYVGEFGGFDTVDYSGLLNHMEGCTYA